MASLNPTTNIGVDCDICRKPIINFALGFFANNKTTDKLGLYHLTCFQPCCSSLTLKSIAEGKWDTARLTKFIMDHDGIPASHIARLRDAGFPIPGELPTTERVYFIQSGYFGPIKIGFTSGDPSKRVASLQTAHPDRLRLLASIPGGKPKEFELHQRFANYRLSGEWFSPHEAITNFISTQPQ